MVTLVGYWLIAIPISATLVFGYGYGIPGLWIGPLIASIFLTSSYLIKMRLMDWDKIIIDVAERHEKEKQDYLQSLEYQDEVKEETENQ
jgi:Na+-driven multidrug efflux pump